MFSQVHLHTDKHARFQQGGTTPLLLLFLQRLEPYIYSPSCPKCRTHCSFVTYPLSGHAPRRHCGHYLGLTIIPLLAVIMVLRNSIPCCQSVFPLLAVRYNPKPERPHSLSDWGDTFLRVQSGLPRKACRYYMAVPMTVPQHSGCPHGRGSLLEYY